MQCSLFTINLQDSLMTQIHLQPFEHETMSHASKTSYPAWVKRGVTHFTRVLFIEVADVFRCAAQNTQIPVAWASALNCRFHCTAQADLHDFKSQIHWWNRGTANPTLIPHDEAQRQALVSLASSNRIFKTCAMRFGASPVASCLFSLCSMLLFYRFINM